MDKQQRLFAAARKCFSQSGFKQTSIAQIAAEAGVAVGTFYNFYESKTAIFLAVYNAENETAKRQVLAQVDLTATPTELLPTVLNRIFQVTQDNRILQEWFNNAQLNAKVAQLNRTTYESSYIYTTLMQLVDQWRTRGWLKETVSQGRIMSLFSALTVVDLHQRDLQTADYYQLLNDLVQGILAVILK